MRNRLLSTVVVITLMAIFSHLSSVHANRSCYSNIIEHFRCRDNLDSIDEKVLESELDPMDVDKAMQLYRTIFNATDYRCQSEYCKCMRLNIAGDIKVNTILLFANERIVEQIKQILIEFNEKYPYDPMQEVETANPNGEGKKFKSVEKFCSLYDFSVDKISRNRETRSCLETLPNSVSLFFKHIFK